MSMKKREKICYSEDIGTKYLIRSPGVGKILFTIDDGVFITGGNKIGRMKILNKNFILRIPNDMAGSIRLLKNHERITYAAYNEIIFELEKSKKIENNESVIKEDVNITQTNGLIIKSFIDGIFFRRPSPDSEPFVQEGSLVKPGDTLGLIEVMKSFNKIICPDFKKGRNGFITEIYKKDESVIRSGEPLFRIKLSGED